jgi:cytochrome c oxidase subunit III
VSSETLTASTTNDWKLPSPRKVGMMLVILTESALFTIFVVAYLFYIGKSLTGPYPHDVFKELPIPATVVLLGSSITIMIAEYFLKRGKKAGFHLWWAITILMGAGFLVFTGLEWYELIYKGHLTLSTNLFGSTFYSLVGLHASHVVVGLILLTLILISSLRGKIKHRHHEHIEMISWYWHFVDVVWIIVFTVVYIISRNS